MTSQRARAGATVLGAAGVAFGVIQLLQGTVSAFDPRPVVSLTLAVAVGIVGVTLERLRHTIGRRRVLSGALHAWPLLSVSDADPLALGIFPARTATHCAQGAPYVARDADENVEKAARNGGIVVVYGPPRAGKSRTAYEAARVVLPDRPVVIPDGGAALRRAVQDASFVPPDGAVWWLDDLERFMQQLEGTVVEALVDSRWTVVTTVREDSWRELLRAAGDSGDRGRRLLAAATTIHLPSQLSAREYEAAGELYPGIDVSNGIGEALAAGSDHQAVPADERGGHQRTREPFDAVLGLSIALSLVAVAIVASLVSTGGFAVRRAPPIGAQIEAIRQAAARAGKTTVLARAIRLHEVDQPSQLLVMRPESAGSDELRIYDNVDGRLRLQIAFQPTTGGIRGAVLTDSARQMKDPSIDYALDTADVTDVDGDGTSELIASYLTQSTYPPVVRIPTIIAWDDRAARYRLSPLLSSAPPSPIHRADEDKAFRGAYTLTDTARHEKLRGFGVSSLILMSAGGPAAGLLADGIEADQKPSGRSLLAISLFDLTLIRARPSVSTKCALDGSRPPGVVLRSIRPVLSSDYRRMLRRVTSMLAPDMPGTAVDGACHFRE